MKKLLSILMLSWAFVCGQAQQSVDMDWWREGRFGMFIHWGLYSVAAGEWNGKPVDGMYSIRAAMVGVRPGETVPVEVRRRNQVIEGKLLTGPRPRVMKFPQKRLDMMNSMGNRMSLKRDEFPLVIQSDMTLFPERAGCPVIDVNGKFVGLALSRAGRTETYILPSWICRELVEGVLPQVQQYRAGRGENIPEAQPVDDSYDARRLEENRRKVEDKMSRQGLVPKVY